MLVLCQVKKREVTDDEIDEERRRIQMETEAGASAAKRRKEAEVAGEINLSLIEQVINAFYNI